MDKHLVDRRTVLAKSVASVMFSFFEGAQAEA